MSDLPVSVTKAFEEIRSDYRAAKTTRFTPRVNGVAYNGSGSDYHYRNDYEYLYMIERARHYERNDMLVGQGIRRLVSNVVQEGFMPDPDTGDSKLDEIFKENWREFSTDPDLCHSEGELTFNQIERLTLRSAIRDGDIWSLLLDDGTIQPIEGHRPRTPSRTRRNVVHGVFMDDRAKRQEVWITKEDIGIYNAITRVNQIQPYAIRDEFGHRVVLQTYFPDRFSQRRGVTALAPVAEVIGMHDDLEFSTLVKSQLASLLVILREQHQDVKHGLEGPPIGDLRGSVGTEQTSSGGVKQIPGIQAGVDYLAPPGQTVKGFAPNIPNPEFFPHTMLLLTFIAVNLDMPVQMLLLDPQKSSFSSWRGAVDQARTRFREIQSDLAQQFHRPVWKWKVRQWASESSALRRMIGDNPHWLRHTWKRPQFAYIEPLKDAQADALQQEKFLSSPRRLQAARGRDWDEVVRECIDDREKLFRGAIETAQSLSTEFGVEITWKDILSSDFGTKIASTAATKELPEDEED